MKSIFIPTAHALNSKHDIGTPWWLNLSINSTPFLVLVSIIGIRDLWSSDKRIKGRASILLCVLTAPVLGHTVLSSVSYHT